MEVHTPISHCGSTQCHREPSNEYQSSQSPRSKTRREWYNTPWLVQFRHFYARLWYNTFTNREPTKFTSLSKIQGVVFNSISCCVLNNTVTNHVRRTRISRAARGRFAPGVDARCVLIASFVYFIAFVYKFRGYRDELAESPAKSKL